MLMLHDTFVKNAVMIGRGVGQCTRGACLNTTFACALAVPFDPILWTVATGQNIG